MVIGDRGLGVAALAINNGPTPLLLVDVSFFPEKRRVLLPGYPLPYRGTRRLRSGSIV
jgi:hypothetical protein